MSRVMFVQDEERRKSFRQFVNSDHNERGISFVDMRGQQRPIDWLKDELIPGLWEDGKVSQVLVSWSGREGGQPS